MPKQTIDNVLESFIADSKRPKSCTVQRWLYTLPKSDQEKFESLKKENKNVKIKDLYEALLSAGIQLPTKLTAFRSHFREYCTCKK